MNEEQSTIEIEATTVTTFAKDDMVIKSGLIFRAGDYPDKKFAITADELKKVVANFSPVDLDYSHVDGVLDSKLGKLVSIRQGDNPEELYGDVAIPASLDALMGLEKIPVSTTWDIPTKKLVKLALVKNPRVPDAAVMSASQFAAFENTLAEYIGARHNSDDLASLQTIHDTVASMGAKCGATLEKTEPVPDVYTDTGQSKVTATYNQENPKMSEATTDSKAAPTDQSAIFSAQIAELSAVVEAQNKQLAQLAAERRRTNAVAFAADQVREGKIPPAAREWLVALFDQAERDDQAGEQASAVVVFSAGKNKEQQAAPIPSRTEAIRGLFAALPKSLLTEELVSGRTSDKLPGSVKAMFALNKSNSGNGMGATNDIDGPDDDADEKDKQAKYEKVRLLSYTDAGKAALARLKKEAI